VRLPSKVGNNSPVFYSIPSLTERSNQLGYKYLKNKAFINADSRYFGDTIQKFINYNFDSFRFLNIIPHIHGNGKQATISFSSGKFIGAIPLRSPINGMQIGDFIVKPRFTSEVEDLFAYGELISLLENDISPEYMHSLPLKSRNSVKPPLYIQASKFIQELYKTLLSTEWVKFLNRVNLIKEPKGEIYWKRYIEKDYDPQQKLIFPCRENYLSQQHKEFFEIMFVYSLARNTLLSPSTPLQIRVQLDQIIRTLDMKIGNYERKETREINIHQFDFPAIKTLKQQANSILANNYQEITAWKIDLELLFERFTQYVFRSVCRDLNLKQVANHHIYRASFNSPDWSLRYLEPDLILINDELSIVVDAKYKSHFFNLNQNSENLHEEHRRDLHQVLAYSSFLPTKKKYAMICFPFSKYMVKTLDYTSDLLRSRAKIFLFGIPMNPLEVPQIASNIRREIEHLF